MTAERQIRFWLIGFAVFFGALWFLKSVLLPFVLGMAVAYLFDPICDRLEKIGCSRTLATSLVTLGFVLVMILLLLMLLPLVIGQLINLMQNAPAYFEAARQGIGVLIEQLSVRLDPAILDRIREGITGQAGAIASWASSFLSNLASGLSSLLNFFSLLVLTPVVAFFLLRDWDKMVKMIDSWLPRRHRDVIVELAEETDMMLAGWVRGVAIVCSVLATFYAVGLTLVGLESGLLIGLIAGFLSFIPFVGAAVGFFSSVGLALLQFDSIVPVLIVAGIFFAGQAIEGNYLTPKLVGERVGLHPVAVIFALLAGGTLFGFTGVLLAMPIAAVVGVGARFTIKQYLASPLYGAEEGEEDKSGKQDGDGAANA